MSAQFRKAGLPFRFFDAIDGSCGLDDRFDGIDEQAYRLNTYRDPLPGEIGCYASHVALWQRCVALDEPIVILEDDCQLESSFPDAIALAAKLIQEFGFIRLQSFDRAASLKLMPASRLLAEFDGFSVHYLSNVPLCLLAYAVSPSRAAQLVDSSRRISSPIDKFVQRTWEHGTPIFAMAPASVTTSALAAETTIGDRRTKKKSKVALAVRRARYKLRGELKRRGFDRQQLRRFRAGPRADW